MCATWRQVVLFNYFISLFEITYIKIYQQSCWFSEKLHIGSYLLEMYGRQRFNRFQFNNQCIFHYDIQPQVNTNRYAFVNNVNWHL